MADADRISNRPGPTARLKVALGSLHAPGGDGIAGDMVEEIIKVAAGLDASDIHIDPIREGAAVVRLRLDGVLHPSTTLPPEPARRLVGQVKARAGLPPTAIFNAEEARFQTRVGSSEVDVRVTLVPTVSGPKVALRLLYPERIIRQTGELGLVDEDRLRLVAFLEQTGGLVLVAGPTASGKTTTVTSLVHHLHTAFGQHVVTIEDPVEYVLPGVTQIDLDPDRDLTLANALGVTLRLDPDCMVIGEVRDRATCRACVSMAANGRSVMATIHTESPVACVTRMRHWGIPDAEIAASLGLVVSQRLVRKLCPGCRRRAGTDEADRRWLVAAGMDPAMEHWAPGECDDCAGTGYAGRTGLFAIWQPDRDISDRIAAGASAWDLVEHQGVGLHQDAERKLADGTTSLAELRRVGVLSSDVLIEAGVLAPDKS